MYFFILYKIDPLLGQGSITASPHSLVYVSGSIMASPCLQEQCDFCWREKQLRKNHYQPSVIFPV